MPVRIPAGLARWSYPARWQQLHFFASFLLALFLLASLVRVTLYLSEQPDDGLEWSLSTGKISQVNPSGPTPLLQPDDRVIALDGIPLAEANPLYLDKQPGDEVTFSIERAGQPRTVVIQLIAPSPIVLAGRLVPLFIAFIFGALGVIILAFKPTDSTARLFFYFSQISSGVLVFGALSTTGLPAASQLFALFLWFLGPITLHLHFQFPRRSKIPHQPLLLRSAYGIACIGSCLSLIDFPDWMAPDLWSTGLAVAVRIYLSVSFVAATGLLFHTYRSVGSSQARQQIQLVFWGAAVAFIPPGILALLPEVLVGIPLIRYEISFLFLLAIPLTYGYGIARYHLILFDRPISRGLTYLLVIVLTTGLYILLGLGLNSLAPDTIRTEPLVALLLALIATPAFFLLRDPLHQGVDSVLYGSWHHYDTAVQKLSRALDGVTDTPKLVNVLAGSLRETLRLESAHLLLRSRDGNYSSLGTCLLCPQYQTNACNICLQSQISQLSLSPAGALCQWLEKNKSPIGTSALREELARTSLTSAEQQLLDAPQACLWVPLVESNRLLGILILGPKQDDDPFYGEDFHVLEMVRRQVSITIQNISLLFELRQRTVELGLLHRQLLRAREEERKRLARELHDDIIQSLVGLNYDLSQYQSQGAVSDNEQNQRLQHQVYQLINDVRKVCSELRPPALDSLGLVSAIRSRLRDLEAEGNWQVRLIVDGDEETSVPDEIGICLFRVLQEALINIQKHARATQVVVRLSIGSREVCLSIEDNGVGFSLPSQLSQLIEQGHFGLVGARERLELLGGKLILSSVLGQGTRLEIQVPLHPTGLANELRETSS